MKIIRHDLIPRANSITAMFIPVGTVFSGDLNDIDGEGGVRICLRTYSQIVDLESPGNTWSLLNFTVYNYVVLDVELHVMGRST